MSDQNKHEKWLDQDGEVHRENGPAEKWNGGALLGGSEWWCRHGKLHRTDGPAVQRFGGAARGGEDFWYRDDELHRLEGPAVQRGHDVFVGSREEWWIDGKRLHRKLEKHLIGMRFDSEEEARATINHIKELLWDGLL